MNLEDERQFGTGRVAAAEWGARIRAVADVGEVRIFAWRRRASEVVGSWWCAPAAVLNSIPTSSIPPVVSPFAESEVFWLEPRRS